jgi:hypothetical protein
MGFRTSSLQSVAGWLGRLVRLDLTVFEEIRSHPSATTGAIGIVFGSGILAGIGSWLWAVQWRGIEATEVFIKSLVIGSILQTLVWFIWVYIVFMVLVRAYGARTDFAELTRTMGFAFCPMALSVLVGVPNFTVPFGVISITGTALLTFVATQSASGGDARQALVANFAGFSVFAVVMGVLANIGEVEQIGGGARIGGIAPGLFFFDLNF